MLTHTKAELGVTHDLQAKKTLSWTPEEPEVGVLGSMWPPSLSGPRGFLSSEGPGLGSVYSRQNSPHSAA